MGLTMTADEESTHRYYAGKIGEEVQRMWIAELDATRAALAEEREHADRLAEALTRASDYAADLRSYCDAWGWKYDVSWNDDKAVVDAALAAHAARRKEAGDAPVG